jgi:hypothetical protein
MANMANSTPTQPAPPDPVTQTLALLQPWIEFVPQRQRRLGLFIFIALLVHLATFFFIRIDTTRAELQHQARTHVSVEYPQALAVDGAPGDNFWDRLTDPQLFLMPQKAAPGLAVDESQIDLNSNLSSHQLPPAAPTEAYRAARPVAMPLEQQVVATLRPARQPFHYEESSPAIAAATTWRWDAGLAARQPMGVPALPSPISDTDLTPTVLNVSIDQRGTVENALVEQSSGGDLGAPIAKDLDQQAVLAAKKIRFAATDKPGLQWGRITVFWNYSAKPQEEVVPTPPSTGP